MTNKFAAKCAATIFLGALMIMVGLLALGVGKCHADEAVTTTSACQRIPGGGVSCTARTTTRELAKPRQWSQLTASERAEIMADEEARDQRIAKWEAFCKPTLVTDAYGVSRYTYAQKNCDLGRSE